MRASDEQTDLLCMPSLFGSNLTNEDATRIRRRSLHRRGSESPTTVGASVPGLRPPPRRRSRSSLYAASPTTPLDDLDYSPHASSYYSGQQQQQLPSPTLPLVSNLSFRGPPSTPSDRSTTLTASGLPSSLAPAPVPSSSSSLQGAAAMGDPRPQPYGGHTRDGSSYTQQSDSNYYLDRRDSPQDPQQQQQQEQMRYNSRGGGGGSYSTAASSAPGPRQAAPPQTFGGHSGGTVREREQTMTMSRSNSDFIAGPPYGSISSHHGNGHGDGAILQHAPLPPPPQLAAASSSSSSSRDPLAHVQQQHRSNHSSPRNHSPAPSSTSNREFAPAPAPVGASSATMGSSASAAPGTINGRRNSTALTPTSGGGGSMRAPPATIAGEPLHDLDRAIGLLRSSKFYAEGFLMKKVEVGPDGKAHPGHPESQWAKWFVQLSGTIMSTWNAAEMELAARQNRTVPPQYLNLADVFVHPYAPNPSGPPTPTPFQFALNSAGLNRVLFCAPNEGSLMMWINAIRLAAWERSRCNEIYTGTLLGLREPKPAGWIGYDAGLTPPGSPANTTGGKFEGHLKARLPGDTEWRKTWAVLIRAKNAETGSLAASGGSTTKKKDRRGSILGLGGAFGKKQVDATDIDDLPGDGAFATLAFYANKPTKKEVPLCIAQHVFYASAIYPESEKLIDRSGLFKIEGTFLNPNDGYRSGWGVGGRAERQGYALLMVEEGAAAAMLQWIVGLSDAFKLYGRPRGFSFDPRDPSSMYFALPIGPHRDRQFLDRELVDGLDINESRPRAIRAVFHNILFDRMRGIRPAALPPPPASATSSAAPQLAPVTRTPPLQIREEEHEDDEGTRDGEYVLAPQLAPVEESESPPAGSLAVGQRSDLGGSSNYHSTLNEPIPNYANFVNSSEHKREPSPPPPVATTTNMSRRPSLPPIVTGAPPKLASYPSQQQHQPTTPNYSRPMSQQMQHAPELEPDLVRRDRDALNVPPTTRSEVSSVGGLPYLGEQKHEESHAGVSEEPFVPPASAVYEPPPLARSSPPIPQKSSARPQSASSKSLSPPLPVVSQFPAATEMPSVRAVEPEPEPVLHSPPQTTRNLVAPTAVAPETSSPQASGSSDIHSDLLAALHYVDRSESPPPPSSVAATPSTIYDHGSPAETAQAWHVGPPRRMSHSMFDPGSPVVDGQATARFTQPTHWEQKEELRVPPVQEEEDVTPRALSTVLPAAPAPPPPQQPTSFPSSFAPNKRAEERAAAALLAQQAQQAQQAAMSRPGRSSMVHSTSTNSNSRKPRAWVDSDEDEDEPEEEDDDSDEEDAGAARRRAMQMPPPPAQQPGMLSTRESQSGGMNRFPSQGEIHRLGSPEHTRPMMASSPSRGDFQVLREPSPQPVAQPLKAAVSPHGLLHAGIIDKEERSAKALEMAARDTGGPLVSLPSKPPPPQTGLVGAITSHEREKERTGGVGRALTEQQKEKKLAEQRQKQLDELQRQQLAQQQYQMQAQYQQMQMMQAYGGAPAGYPGMPPYGGAPWMMGGYPGYPPMMPPTSGSQIGVGGVPASASMTPQTLAGSPVLSPLGGGAAAPHQAAASPAMDPYQQHHIFAAQQAAQAAAAAAYQAAMAQFSAPVASSSPSGASPGLPASMSQPFPPFPAAAYGSPGSPPMGFASYSPYAGFGGSQMGMMVLPHQQQMMHQQQQQGAGGEEEHQAGGYVQDRAMSPMQLPH